MPNLHITQTIKSESRSFNRKFIENGDNGSLMTMITVYRLQLQPSIFMLPTLPEYTFSNTTGVIKFVQHLSDYSSLLSLVVRNIYLAGPCFTMF